MSPPEPKDQLALSVQERTVDAFAREAPIVFYLSQTADIVPEWPSQQRDIFLDKFWRTEPLLAGAVYSMCSKVAALDFSLTGPPKSVVRYENMFRSADFGQGWVNFLMKEVQDLLTQDNGGFMEVIRPRGTDERSPVAAIAHLDSQRCWRTGKPQEPVIYYDLEDQPHPLKWYQVAPLTDLPTPREIHKNYGYCAVSRILRAAQTLRDIGIYKRQKLSGKRVPGLMFVQGMRRTAVAEAVAEAMESQTQGGMTLYTKPIILSSPDPGLPLDVKLIELASLPDGYNEDDTMKWYITSLALGFGTDYTEFAPLPGGNLGSATQATIMSSRSRGKGPGVILQQLEHIFNWYVLPKTTFFQFSSTDPQAERDREELKLLRARARSLLLRQGELNPELARKIAVEAGDYPEKFIKDIDDPETEQIDRIVKGISELKEAHKRVEQLVTTDLLAKKPGDWLFPDDK